MSDNWDFYFCQVENHPASIFLDLGINNDVPIAGLDDVVWLRLCMQQPKENGLSSNEEHQRLCEVEDAVNHAIENAETRIIYTGRCTSAGCREFFFYAENGTQAESWLSMAMVPFPEYEFEVGSRPDPEWKAYRDFLYPLPRDYQTILNEHVLRNLEKNGDRHEIEREVSHWIYFASQAERDRFQAAAVEKGYKVVSQDDDGQGERKFGLTVAKTHAVDFSTINNVVLELFDLAGECAGDYDGWETSVEKGE